MKKITLDIIRIIFTLITILLAIVSIYLILDKLFGHSPTEETIILSVIGILLTLQVVVITILFQIKEDLGNLKEFKRQTNIFKEQTIKEIRKLKSS